MYTIRLDDTLMFDPRVDELEIFDARAQFEVNKTNGLDFTVYPSHPLYARFKRFKSIVELYQNNLLLFRGRVLNDEAGLYNEKKIICEGELAYFNDTIIRPFEFQGTIEGFLSYIISQHNSQVENIKKFTLGNVTVTNSTNNIVRSSIDAQTSWEIINNRLIKLLGGYIVLRRENNINYIDYLADSNYMSLQKIELGKNLLDLTRRINGDEVITALIPYGAKIDEQSDERITIKSVNNNIDYIYDQEAVEKHGWIFGTETWDDVTIPSNLLTKARQTLAAGILLNSSIELTALDLSLMDISIDEFRIFEYVKVEVPTHLIDDNLLISKMSLDILSPENNKLTLGLDIQTFTERQIQTEKAISNIVTIKGPKGDSGNDGVAGKDGVGIKTTAITYVGSTSGVTKPTTGWVSTIPNVPAGQYLWTRTIWTYTDNTTETGYSVAKMGDKGDSGVSIVKVDVEYAQNTSPTTAPTTGWQTTGPAWVDGKYIWSRTKTTYSTGDPTYTNAACITGGIGPSGEEGVSVVSIAEFYAVSTSNATAPTTWQTTVQQMTATNKYLWNYEEFTLSDGSKMPTKKRVIGVYGDKGTTGDDGKGIKSNAVTYQIGDSGTTAPTGAWNAAIPTPVKGKYLWARTITTYTDNTNSTIYSVSYLPTDGQNGGAGVGVQSTAVTYQLHTNGATAPTGTWTATIPTPVKGRYLWSKTVITYTNSTTSTAYSTSYYPLDGQNGESGSDGNSISSVTNYYLASASATGVTTATAGWTIAVQVPTTTKKYLWNYEVIKYSKIADTVTTPTIIGVYGETGNKGDVGQSVDNISEEYYLSTSKTGQAGGSWKTTPDKWTAGKYMWTRSKIVYKNPAKTEYTTPVLDSSWEAIEDLEQDIKNELDDKASNDYVTSVETTLNTTIEESAGEFRREMSESYTSKSEFGTYKETVSSQFDQTAKGFGLTFKNLIEQIETLDGETKATFDEIVKYIRFVDGNIVLGKVGNELELKIRHDRIQFIQSGVEVAYFSNNKLYVTDGEFINSLKLGNFAFIPRENGSLDFRKVVN